jgi:DNA-binding MarR family transcriptional regulator
MQTHMQPTSIAAYAHITELGKDEKQEQQILHVMGDNRHLDFTRRELAKIIGMETSTMSARVNSLVKKGDVIELSVKRKCTESGMKAIALQLPPIQAVLAL